MAWPRPIFVAEVRKQKLIWNVLFNKFIEIKLQRLAQIQLYLENSKQTIEMEIFYIKCLTQIGITVLQLQYCD